MNPLLLLTIAGGGLWLLSKRKIAKGPPPRPGDALVRCNKYRGHTYCVWSRPGYGGREYDVTIDGGPSVISDTAHLATFELAVLNAEARIDEVEGD